MLEKGIDRVVLGVFSTLFGVAVIVLSMLRHYEEDPEC
jgi:hypothetical protein